MWALSLAYSNVRLYSLFMLLAVCLTMAGAWSPMKHGHHKQAIANGVDLRILPLGDSITWGEGSSDSNGYRLALATLIKQDGNNLTFIGTVKSGTMPNNENEGHGGFQTLAVGEMGKQDYPERPNIVLLMAGTNDIVFDNAVDNAPKRLGTVIGDIVDACPDAVVLVASILPLLNPQKSNKIIHFNSALMGIVWEFTNKGQKVDLVDMGRVNTSYINTSDGIHPTDQGYTLIAAAWYDGIVRAGKKGWIGIPLPRPSDGQANATISLDDKPSIGIQGSATKEGPRVGNTSTPAQLMVYVLIIFGLILAARKAAVIFLRRYR